MPSMLKYKGELYTKVIDSDNGDVDIVENDSTIPNPAGEHGVSESASEILQKIENLQHELTAEIEKLKSIDAHNQSQTHSDIGEVLSDSLNLENERKLEIIATEIDSYILRKYKDSYPHSDYFLRNKDFEITIKHKASYLNEPEIQEIIIFARKEIRKEFKNAKTHAKFSSKNITISGEIY